MLVILSVSFLRKREARAPAVSLAPDPRFSDADTEKSVGM
jgi:hypothetical protein